jgi:hypothetical protein
MHPPPAWPTASCRRFRGPRENFEHPIVQNVAAPLLLTATQCNVSRVDVLRDACKIIHYPITNERFQIVAHLELQSHACCMYACSFNQCRI